MLAFILGDYQLQFIHMANNRTNRSAPLYVNSNDRLTELDIKQSENVALTLKHKKRVAICNLKLIDFFSFCTIPTRMFQKLTFSVEKYIRDTYSYKPFACLDVIIIHISFAIFLDD